MKDVFENKSERNDFYIAIVVILLFLFFITRYHGCQTDNISPIDTETVAVASTTIAIEDRDGDGIEDSIDACPDLIGTEENNGCPSDSDGDGVYDTEDECPNYAGTAELMGCPEDSDGDGVHNGLDKCPKTKGPQSNNGCPLDADGDGVPDAVDRCPNKAGSAKNGGCPEVILNKTDKEMLAKAMSAVEFQTGSANLKSTSNQILDQVANLLKKNPSYKLSISGHTDNTSGAAGPAGNLSLSKNRASSCFDYLVSQGISAARMSHTGYGQNKPIATNDTKEGRQRNRRVEFKLNY